MSISFSVSPKDFALDYQEKRPLLMKGAVSLRNFSWRDVNEIFERSNVASDDFKLTFDGIRPKSEYIESWWDIGTLRHRLIKPVVYDYLRKGATLIANKIATEPKVNQLSRQLIEFTGRQVVSSAYLAFGERDSFRCHWDTRDVFAIQLIGRKRWVLYEPSLEAPLYMQQSKDYEGLYPCPDTPYMDVMLEAGDLLYLPRGWWHNPLPVGEATFHLAFGTFPAYVIDYLSWAINRMPHLLDARRSLSDWENDKNVLASIGQQFEDFICTRENYRRFLDDRTGAIRIETDLALETLGNPAVSAIPDESRIRLSAYRPPGRDDRYVIANGTKVNLDDQGATLIRLIVERPGISLGTLISGFANTDADRIRDLVTDLCRQDILEFSLA
ncbi:MULTISPECIES: JmjC domain-containing protein [Burkholderia]|jgi:ribosomal protein L16 Arg81 hydroxylase|uniref:Cupin superfamily protein n=3 Tax=Burkholderia multivorans TaxID=87883 RepID=B9BV10_9BURK|nr:MULTISPECIES: cupin domain-containing protein [Burkholderia]AJY17409.1 cupin-like domain protein [Burkholderia multivorans ATCC BAA-247]AOJ91877.1 cupin [Burkholderia multivorans]AVR21002.1 cupin [Burkholderia multivorans]EEE05215.1 cupin superfamily protein [Burkholderia multivorans CGD2]EEE10960.1 cupin superfamily protein [Burkholderia multivorans CGD2M]